MNMCTNCTRKRKCTAYSTLRCRKGRRHLAIN